jgi:hypothetical protein
MGGGLRRNGYFSRDGSERAVEETKAEETIKLTTQAEQPKKPFAELLAELASYPEFQELINIKIRTTNV